MTPVDSSNGHAPAAAAPVAKPGASTALRWRLRAGVRSTLNGTTVTVGSEQGAAIQLAAASRGTRLLLEQLAGSGAPESDLAGVVVAADGEQGLLGMHLTLAKLTSAGLLDAVLHHDGLDVAELSVVGQGSIRLAGRADPMKPVRLERTVVIHPEDGRLVVRSPRSPLRLAFAPPLAPLLAAMTMPITPGQLIATLGPVARDAVRLLMTAGALAATPEDPVRQQWETHDLLLHTATRSPRTVGGYGGTYRGRGVREPLPAIPAARGTTTLALPTPDLAALRAGDPTLTDVTERRRSRRVHDNSQPISLEQLGELLYRTVRLRRTFGGTDGEQVTDRPYPSGGAAHELEVYPLITHCAGVEPGLWHYRTEAHDLELVSEPSRTTAALVARARAAAVMESDPQVLLLITARFGRVMFKYQSIGYALILKHVGVLYQALYLAGTAMDLAVCALGGGDADLFAAASGLDYYAEGTVGELVVGSPGVEGDAAWRGEDRT